MDTQTLETLQRRFPNGRTLFPYFKDRYVLMLLRNVVGAGMPLHELKQTRFGGWLHKPLLQELTRLCPDGWITPERLSEGELLVPSDEWQTYRLTVGAWGHDGYWEQGVYQTSRPGHNLVLQLNFSNQHNRPYEQLIRPQNDWHPFAGYGHPVVDEGEHTLAWARLDIDPDRGEALIEEIQTDWLRKVRWKQEWIENYPDRVSRWKGRVFHPNSTTSPRCTVKTFRQYADTVLRPHQQLWDEAMLAAAIWYVQTELGIKRLFFHTFEGGNTLKGMRWSQPPRSLYSTLPRRFGFRPTTTLPAFLQTQRRVRKQSREQSVTCYVLEI